MVKEIMEKIADITDVWRAGAMTGQLVITVDFTQGYSGKGRNCKTG
jgi:hypothetical protein